MKILEIDFLFTRLRNDIIYFYKTYYFGKDYVSRMNYSLYLLRTDYEPSEFKNLSVCDLREKKEKLLTKIQNKVENSAFC